VAFGRREKGGDMRPDANQMTLVEHLGELRTRLIIAVGAVFVGAIAAYILYNPIIRFFESPLCQVMFPVTKATPHPHCNLVVFSPLAQFTVRLQIAGYGGLLLALPIILFELWRFVTPGLKANEKKYTIPFVVATSFLFALGAFIAWVVFPHALGFFNAVAGPHVGYIPQAQPYLKLIIVLMIMFGVAFEFPVVLVALEIAGVITPQQLRKSRKAAIIGITVFAAVITPSSDPFSMLGMMIPMLFFYEMAIVVGALILRRRTISRARVLGPA
jgi:sec-independent protein translocase protein TatC